MGLACGKSSPDCTLYLQGQSCGKFQADPDITGIGVIAAIVATSLVNLTIVFLGHTLSILRGYEQNAIDSWISRMFQRIPLLQMSKDNTAFWRPILEGLVLLLSDYQLLFGVAILIAGFWKHCTISVYHFSMIINLAWFPSTHMTSLSVLTCYVQERPTLRNWRLIIMIIMLFMLLAALGLASNPLWSASAGCNAQCLFDQPEQDLTNTYPYIVALLLHYSTSIWRVFDTSFFDNYLLRIPRNLLRDIEQPMKVASSSNCSQGLPRVQTTVASYLSPKLLYAAAIRLYLAVGATLGSVTLSLYYDILWFSIGLAGVIKDREISVSYMEGNENVMSFGQIVPVLLLASIVLTFKEVYTDQKIGIGGRSIEEQYRSERTSASSRTLGMATPTSRRPAEDLEFGDPENRVNFRTAEKSFFFP